MTILSSPQGLGGAERGPSGVPGNGGDMQGQATVRHSLLHETIGLSNYPAQCGARASQEARHDGGRVATP